MPSGKIHSATSAILSAGLYYAAYRAGEPVVTCAALAGGCLAGIVLTPDLDVDQGSISNAHARRLGGCWFGLIWALLWKPYAWIVPHRSPLSHAPLIGTTLRLGYLVLVALIFIGIFKVTGVSVPALPAWWPWAFAGLALSDLAHFILDNTSRSKRNAKPD